MDTTAAQWNYSCRLYQLLHPWRFEVYNNLNIYDSSMSTFDKMYDQFVTDVQYYVALLINDYFPLFRTLFYSVS